jgi:hypothetical protein
VAVTSSGNRERGAAADVLKRLDLARHASRYVLVEMVDDEEEGPLVFSEA